MADIDHIHSKAEAAILYTHQAEKLSFAPPDEDNVESNGATAVEAKFITPLDNVVETANGERLPGVPPMEALKFNELKNKMEGLESPMKSPDSMGAGLTEEQSQTQSNEDQLSRSKNGRMHETPRNLGTALPPARTHPLFPPLPLYGPPSLMRNFHCMFFQATSFFLSLAFLGVIVLGSAFTSIPLGLRHVWKRITFRDPDDVRPFKDEERRRRDSRHAAEQMWDKRKRQRVSNSDSDTRLDKAENGQPSPDGYEPTEGGKDPIICDIGYYARRVGLDSETFEVQTEDGFIITMWHIFNPKEYEANTPDSRSPHRPVVFPEGHVESGHEKGASAHQFRDGNRRYPVLMIHGLLQSAGAYCVNDEHSLAFYLAKSGYDVWLGNNRCGFDPKHTMLKYNDPRMWAWNIRQMGVMDLPALVSRVLSETGFPKLGLICHSQGTTQTFVALAKEQRPELGEKISVFCALAPAVYAGPLIGKMYFKLMRIISPAMFRVVFGIHAFIPFMMTMHKLLPATLYGAMGYRVFSFLFNWSDIRWDRGLRDRMFQFAPVYVSAESMRWWLGRECFAKQKCILSTRDQLREEEEDDGHALADYEAEAQDEDADSDLDEQVRESTGYAGDGTDETETPDGDQNGSHGLNHRDVKSFKNYESAKRPGESDEDAKRRAWYDEKCPPFALWIAGSDDLVDGVKLLRRFKRGREPFVRLVHAKVIPEYEHLDVIWAMDCIEQVGKEVKEVIWKTASAEARKICRTPRDCEDIEDFLSE